MTVVKVKRTGWDRPQMALVTKRVGKHSSSGRIYEILHDRFTISRGTPHLLKLFCARCNADIAVYQKDGPGRLLRCYLDRFLDWRLQHAFTVETWKKGEKLACPKCHAILGTPMIYEREKRPAYLLNQSAIRHKKENI